MSVPPLDEELGIQVYATKSLGVGGSIRETVDDFVVQEVLVDGSKAPIDGTVADKSFRVHTTEAALFALYFS